MRNTAAVLAGLATWLAVSGLFALAAQAAWPAYAAAVPHRDYTFAMLALRLGAGALASLVSGAATARISTGSRQAVLITGGVLLTFSAIRHYQVWAEYPVWYHLIFLAYLVPLTLLGSKLVPSR